MKKLIFSCIILFSCIPAFAHLTQGDRLLGARLGLGFQLENSGITYSGTSRVDWGTLGADCGFAYYYLATDHVGIGVDFSYGDFDGGDLFVSSDKVSDETKLLNTMFSTRLTANPSSIFRWYMPLGLGLTFATQKLEIHTAGLDYSAKDTDVSLGWFVGAGFEFDLGRKSTWSIGFETRYNSFRFHTNGLVRNAPPPITGDGNRRLSYLSFQLRLNKRF